MPLLAVEGTDKVLESAKGMKHHMTLLNGGSYFIFYTNAANAVQEGSHGVDGHQRCAPRAHRRPEVGTESDAQTARSGDRDLRHPVRGREPSRLPDRPLGRRQPIVPLSAALADVLADTPPTGQLTVIVRLKSKATLRRWLDTALEPSGRGQRSTIFVIPPTLLRLRSARSSMPVANRRRVTSYKSFWVFERPIGDGKPCGDRRIGQTSGGGEHHP